jgi:hypothetical protein
MAGRICPCAYPTKGALITAKRPSNFNTARIRLSLLFIIIEKSQGRRIG